MPNNETVTWEYCPISARNQHTQYRGFDVHQWMGFVCFYPTEGEATETELHELATRIKDAMELSMFPVKHHRWKLPDSSYCSLKQRLDESELNYCLLTWNIESLNEIIDGLWAASGLRNAGSEALTIKEGRVR